MTILPAAYANSTSVYGGLQAIINTQTTIIAIQKVDTLFDKDWFEQRFKELCNANDCRSTFFFIEGGEIGFNKFPYSKFYVGLADREFYGEVAHS